MTTAKLPGLRANEVYPRNLTRYYALKNPLSLLERCGTDDQDMAETMFNWSDPVEGVRNIIITNPSPCLCGPLQMYGRLQI